MPRVESRDKEKQKPSGEHPLHRLYEKLPITYRQINAVVGALLVCLIALIALAVVKGGGK